MPDENAQASTPALVPGAVNAEYEAVFLTPEEVLARNLPPIVPINVPGLVITGYHQIKPINVVAETSLSAEEIAAIASPAAAVAAAVVAEETPLEPEVKAPLVEVPEPTKEVPVPVAKKFVKK